MIARQNLPLIGNSASQLKLDAIGLAALGQDCGGGFQIGAPFPILVGTVKCCTEGQIAIEQQPFGTDFIDLTPPAGY